MVSELCKILNGNMVILIVVQEKPEGWPCVFVHQLCVQTYVFSELSQNTHFSCESMYRWSVSPPVVSDRGRKGNIPLFCLLLQLAVWQWLHLMAVL